MSDDGPIVFSFGDDDMPDALKALLAKMTGRSPFGETGLANDPAEDLVRPSEEQLGLMPGDYVAITHTKENQNSAFMIGEIVDAEKHQEEFPDYADRLLRSFLLLSTFTPDDAEEPLLGWLPRARMVQIPKDRFEEIHGWMLAGEGPPTSDPPSWIVMRYAEAMLGLANANSDEMPIPILCPSCHHPAVLVTIFNEAKRVFAMGQKKSEMSLPWKKLYVTSPYGETVDTTCHLDCRACGYHEILPGDIEMFG